MSEENKYVLIFNVLTITLNYSCVFNSSSTAFMDFCSQLDQILGRGNYSFLLNGILHVFVYWSTTKFAFEPGTQKLSQPAHHTNYTSKN